MTPQTIARLLASMNAGRLLVVCGAGLSMAPPSSLPSARSVAAQRLALSAPSPDRSHIGLDPGFVDEHQTGGIKPELPALPALTPTGDVPARLFQREQSFF